MNLKFAAAAFSIVAIAACGPSANSQAPDANAASSAFDAASGIYVSDPRHRYVTFSYLHQGYSRPHLRWREWEATLDWNAEMPEASSVSVVIDASSIDSGVDVFDGHLRGERFFDTENYPQITFQSTNVERTSENAGVITGDLTIKGVTKSVALATVFNKASTGENGTKIGFSATTQVKRSDFGVDFLAPAVSDEIDIIIEVEFKNKTE